MLYLQNTLSGKKEKFTPINENKVGIYVCGVTLYDHIHIGHLKSILTFEILRNYFKYQNMEVKFVRNITDIDDKIIAKAMQERVNPLDLVNRYIDIYHELLKKLEINAPDEEPRVTQYLPQIEKYIKNLEDKGIAYVREDGIYFDTNTIEIEKYPLSKKIIKDLKESEDNKVYSKKNGADFALWKRDKDYGYKSEIFHTHGRPGWHIECSAMHHHTLGEKFDIHGGGRDLIFPHHENEITQSIAHNGVNPANYWIHNGMMTKDGKKLSKSLGNSIYVHDLLKQYSAEGLKLFLLKGQYNQSQEFSIEELKEANNRINQYMSQLNNLKEDEKEWSFLPQFITLLEDNLNTPSIVVLLYQQLKIFQENRSKSLALEILKVLKILSVVGENSTLNILFNKWKKANLHDVYSNDIIQLAEKRKIFKEQKDWVNADKLREEIAMLGWNIIDKENHVYSLEKIE